MRSFAFRLAAAFAAVAGAVFLAGVPAQASGMHLSGTGSMTSNLLHGGRPGPHVNGPAAWKGSAPKSFTPGAVCSNPQILINNNSGLVLEVYDSQTGNGAEVDQWLYDGTNTQEWCGFAEGTWQGYTYYEIVNENSGKCLDDYGYDTYNGAYVDQWDCNGGGNQEWVLLGPIFSQVGWRFSPLTVPNIDLGLSYDLEVYGSSTLYGAKVDLWTGNGTLTQAWCVEHC